MALKVDQVAMGRVVDTQTPKYLAFLNAVQEPMDLILSGKEGWEDGWQNFTGQRISNLTRWPEEVTDEMLVAIKNHYEQYDRDFKGLIRIIPGRGLSSSILAFRDPNFGKNSQEVDQLRAGESVRANLPSEEIEDES